MTEPDSSNYSPGKILRIGAMVRQLLDEQRQGQMDSQAVDSLREVYQGAINELRESLPLELTEELDRLSLPFVADTEMGEAELRIANAQLIGWLDGLAQGFQLLLMAQQVENQTQLAGLRRRQIEGNNAPGGKPGQYL